MANRVLGRCRTCNEYVITGQFFDIVVEQISGHNTTVYYHRNCNPMANHSKD